MMRFLFERKSCGESLAEMILCGFCLFVVLPPALYLLGVGLGLDH